MTYDKYSCEVSNPGLRRDFIGSSDASAITGVSPWDTPLTLWETKVGLRMPKNLTCMMSRGIELEQEAREKMTELTGIEFSPKRIFSEQHPFMMASLDGLSPCGNYSVEIKCPGESDHASAIAGVVPTKYYPQLQHQMLVTGHKIMYYMSYTPHDPIVLKVAADPDYQAQLIEKEKEFYECIKDFREPEKTDRDYNKRNDTCWRDAAQKYIALSSMKKQLDEQVEEARQALLFLAGDQSTEGCGVKVLKTSRKGAIQYQKIPDLKNIDLDYYRSPPIESWRILTTGED